MNFRRGLFRLWVILTVLWVAGITFLSGPGVFGEFRQAAAEQAERTRVLQAMSDEELMALLAQSQAEAQANPAKPVQGTSVRALNPWGSLGRTGAVALLPPLALLALGAALGWAVSGFRHQA
jgi:hypothetical protein